MRIASFILAAAVAAAAPPAAASPVLFDDGWREQKFSLFSSNSYRRDGDSLAIRSDGTVSLLWKALPSGFWQGRTASWRWRVDETVPPTDLTRKGGDDRNISLYFVFLPPEQAAAAAGKSIRALLDAPEARVLMYVWGGAHDPGEILPSPYVGPRGRSVIRRAAGTGTAAERVDLARDHRSAFGSAPGSLVGIAVSSDSDDSGTRVVARLSGLRIE